MASEWYYSIGGTQYGPVSSSELKRLAASEELQPDDMVWKEGLKAWVKANAVKSLFTATIRSHPPPIVPQSVSVSEPDFPLMFETPVIQPHDVRSPGQGFHKQRIAILITVGCGMLATFLPWVHVPIIGAISGARGDGWITLFLFVPALVLTLIGNRSSPLSGGRRLGSVIPAGLAALIGVWKIIDLNSIMADLPKDNPFAEALSMSVSIGIGLYLLVAAGIALAVVSWILEGRQRSRVA